MADAPDKVEALRCKLRMIISHASGGRLHEPEDIDRSVNDICVEISRHKNDVWEQAQKSALEKLSPQAEVEATIASLRWHGERKGSLPNNHSVPKQLMLKAADLLQALASRPSEPTEAMIEAGMFAGAHYERFQREDVVAIYTAMQTAREGAKG